MLGLAERCQEVTSKAIAYAPHECRRHGRTARRRRSMPLLTFREWTLDQILPSPLSFSRRIRQRTTLPATRLCQHGSQRTNNPTRVVKTSDEGLWHLRTQTRLSDTHHGRCHMPIRRSQILDLLCLTRTAHILYRTEVPTARHRACPSLYRCDRPNRNQWCPPIAHLDSESRSQLRRIRASASPGQQPCQRARHRQGPIDKPSQFRK